MKRVSRHETSLVYYGPHPCQTCDPSGKKGTLIVKAGNGAPEYLEFEWPKGQQHEKHPWAYPNNFEGRKLRWVKHKHLS